MASSCFVRVWACCMHACMHCMRWAAGVLNEKGLEGFSYVQGKTNLAGAICCSSLYLTMLQQRTVTERQSCTSSHQSLLDTTHAFDASHWAPELT